ncbi:hypothetical protein L3V43_15035 [Pseudoalteromonas sp. L23]|uniref:5'-methylthioadenosine/S-adenosylhomocysteine nucleosidase family protein n=1 Tax=unclassified Pseudoalteromonas TaxID=194690 RepID=UPI001EF0419A|nr:MULTISPECIES: hypothetical protein [unclassified Pseudoalteromonas]MCF7515120.1 hypothetical protein [Pseudoalteromonas sp. L7]MCF7526956.1 hypothetical protein [Pseudoalteromonas sp. L23]MCX2767363.1 hypothetical protein [Pseudoalteromonas sp. B530]
MDKNTFLAQFDGESKQAVIEYSKQISEIKADVIILMARKAACFYHTLETMGLVRNSAIITTDRVLGMDMSWMNNKSIAIVDELVFTGTTLKDSKSLIQRKTKNVKVTCHVLAVNRDYWESTYIKPDNKYFELDDTSCRSLSSNIVKSMSILPRPYSVDFPLYNRRSLYNYDIAAISACPGWRLFDLSTKLQVENGVRVYTLIPDEDKIKELEEIVGLKITDDNLSKVRIFGRYVGGEAGKKKFSFRVVPFFAFAPMVESEVDKLFSHLVSKTDSHVRIHKCFETAKSKIRLLQYYVANQLAHVWLKDINSLLSEINQFDLEHDDRELSFLFSPPMVGNVRELINKKCRFSPYKRVDSLSEFYVLDRSNKPMSTSAASIAEMQQELTKPFFEMYLNKEVALQKLIKEHGPSEAYNKNNKSVKDRLKKGVTVSELLDLTKACVGNESNLTKISFSLFLDNAIDQGIIVPITSKLDNANSSIITRAFRHGEEVKLSNREFYLISLYLNSIKKNAKKDSLFATEMEKLLVLFISCGANSSFLEEIFDRTNVVSSVAVKFYAFGAVSETSSSFSSSEKFEFDTSKSLSKQLVELGVISETNEPGEGKYKINDTPEVYLEHYGGSKLTNSSDIDARALGQLIAIGYKNGVFKNSGENQTFLASCLYPQNSILALSADIRIFQDRWMSQFNYQFKDSDKANIFATPTLIHNFRASLPYKALCSGIEKFKAIEKGWPKTIFQKLQNAYCDDDESRLAMWEKFWRSPDYNQGGKLPEFYSNLIRKSGIWLTHTKMCVDILSYIIFFNNKEYEFLPSTRKSLNQQSKTLLKVSKRSHELEGLWSRLLKCKYGDNLDSFYHKALTYLSILMRESIGLLNTAKATVGHYGQTENIEIFDSRLRLQITESDSLSGKSLRRLLNEIINDAVRASRNPHNDEPKSFIKGQNINSASNERWLVYCGDFIKYEDMTEVEVVAKGSNSYEWLIFLSNRIISKIGHSNKVRALVYYDLPKDFQPFRIEHNSPEIICNSHDVDISLDGQISKSIYSEIIFVTGRPKGNSINRAHNYIENIWRSSLTPEFDKTLSVSDLISQSFRVRGFKVSSINQGKVMKKVDIIILTILSEEFYAVKSELHECKYVPDSEVTYGNLMIEGCLYDGYGNAKKVLLVKSPDAGNTDMAITISTILNDYEAKVAVLLGIAGGVTSKLNIGDVVIADEVLFYEKSKDTDKGSLSRMTHFRSSRWAKSQISRLEIEVGKGKSRFKLKSRNGGSFTVEKGPIGSGEKVLANSKSEIVEKLKLTHDKTKAVEMEAAGLSMFMEAEGSSKQPKIQHALIIRGISDKADEAKSDDDQSVASENAMKTLCELIKVADFSSLS